MSSTSRSELTEEVVDLRSFIQDYTPGKSVTVPDKITFPENIFIGLFGRTGCGKSSLINSLKLAALGRLRRAQWVEVATQEKAGGHTMFRKIANLTSSIYVIDNRGLDNPNVEQALAEIAAQLDGHRGYSNKVQWSGVDGPEEQGVDALGIDLQIGHPISCAVFVFSAIHDIGSGVEGLNEVVDFLHSHQGRYPIGVITHVDVAERKNVDTLATVLRVAGVGDIYEVANITSEKTKLEEQYQLNLLNLLERCVTVADETAVFRHYQRVEMEKKAEKMVMMKKKASAVATQQAEQRHEVVDHHPAPLQRPAADNRDESARIREWEAMEEERRQVNQLKHDLEKRKMEMEFLQRQHQMKMEWDKQQHELMAERHRLESREKRLQEEERERRFQDELRKVEAEKQRELLRIMEANKSKRGGGNSLINIPCPIQ